MCRERRLAALLRSFRLPADAAAADLRQAYYKEAKQLHPDSRGCGGSAAGGADAFLELRGRYEEARRLLQENADGSAGRAAAAGEAYYYTWTGERVSAGRPRRRRYDWEYWGEAEKPLYEERAVPVHGLPAKKVYAVTGAFLTLATSYAGYNLGRQLDELEEERERRPYPERLRRAVEADYAGIEPPRQSRRAAAFVEDDRREEPSLGFGPLHAAAEEGRLDWLQRCRDFTDCWSAIEVGDARGDTPLHFAAKAGRFSAVRLLLDMGADPSAMNRWRLKPEDLARHAGYNEVAKLLRDARTAAVAAAVEEEAAVASTSSTVELEMATASKRPSAGDAGENPAPSLRGEASGVGTGTGLGSGVFRDGTGDETREGGGTGADSAALAGAEAQVAAVALCAVVLASEPIITE